MPITLPRLDDRTYDDIVQELVARIPAHTPDWSDPRPGDPGVTLLELFAFLSESLLYRVNLIPERQRLAFLRLLGMPLRPARPARGLVTLTPANKTDPQSFTLAPAAVLPKPERFETTTEITVHPVVGEVYYKRRLNESEQLQFDRVLPRLRQVYGVGPTAQAYVTTPLFENGVPFAAGFDVVRDPLDGMLWIALLTSNEKPAEGLVEEVRKRMGDGLQALHVGLAPAIEVPPLDEQIGPRARVPAAWELSYTDPAEPGRSRYIALSTVPHSDTTNGLIRRGTLQLALPAANFIGAPEMGDAEALRAGVGDNPPRLDDLEKAARIVAWLRLRPQNGVGSLPLSWIGVNVAEIEASQTIRGRLLGQSDGSAGQAFNLPAGSVQPDSLQLEVEEPRMGYRLWNRVDDLASAGRDMGAYTLDPTGTITLGTGLRGRIPAAGARLRIRSMRAGGGSRGNLAPGLLTSMDTPKLVGGGQAPPLVVRQDLPTEGGEDAETLTEAEARIPARLRHQERAVTAGDYERLALETPGVRVGRINLLPRFKPHQRLENVPGVVSVMALPYQSIRRAPNPRADRPFLETVFAQLDPRRPLGTELYVIGCEYIRIGVATGITIEEGYPRQETLQAVNEALHSFLWPLPPGGIKDKGWELGRSVLDEELRVVVARVEGVLSVEGINLFVFIAGRWEPVPVQNGTARIDMLMWQLPELSAVVIDPDGAVPDALQADQDILEDDVLPIPVTPEVC